MNLIDELATIILEDVHNPLVVDVVGPKVLDDLAETETGKFVCEVKDASKMKDPEVVQKAAALLEWCRNANEVERKNGGKPWTCLLIPHDAVEENMTLSGLTAKFALR